MKQIMKKPITLGICILLLLVILCSCSIKTKEIDSIEVTSINVLFDYDEKTGAYDSSYYAFAVLKSSNSSIKDHCTFSYYMERSTEWTEDPDGTKHIHTIGDRYETLEYDISVFNDILKTIKKGNPSIYSGPGTDSNKQLVYNTLPYMIVLQGRDKSGSIKTIYIDGIDNKTKLLDAIDQLKTTVK